MTKLLALLNLLRKGQEVANPEKLKDAGNFALILGAFILAAVNTAEAFGYALPFAVTADQANNIGLGIATVIGFFVHNASSAKAGILPARRSAMPGDAAPPERPAALPPEREAHAGIDDETRERAKRFLEDNKDLYFG